MMSKLEKVLVGLCILLSLAFVTTGCFQDILVPAYIDPVAIEYSKEVVPSFIYTNLWDAERVALGLDQQHFLIQRSLARMMEDDDTKYDFLSNAHSYNIASAKELRDNIFSPTSPLGALIPGLSGLGLGWIALSKPSDKKKIVELQNGNGKS